MNAPAKTHGLFTESDYDRAILPSHLKSEVREIIEVAVMVGWKMHIASSNAVTIISPGETRKYHFGVNNRASNNLNRIKKDIFKFGDPEKVLLAETAIGAIASRNKTLIRQATANLPHVGDAGTLVDHRPQLEEEARVAAEAAAERAEQREAEKEAAKAAAKKAVPTPPKKAAEVSQRKSDRHIISSGPMVSKSAEGRGYDSPVIIEQRWSDGSVNYKCAKCDFTSDKRNGVPGHNARTHGRTGGAKPVVYEADTSGATIYAPRQTRVEALAKCIADAMAAGATDPQAIAKEALTWVHEQSKKGTAFASEREDMTPEDTLDRIRVLLDDGTMLRAQQRIEDLEQRTLAAEAKAEAARENLRTFMQLASELATEEEGKTA